jgi:beta-glucosidase
MRMKLAIPFAATAIACGVALVVTACGNGSGINSDPAPTGPDAIADSRAAALVAQMTTAEKIQLVHGVGMPNAGLGGPFPAGINGAGYIPGIPRLGIPGLAMADSAGGVNVANSNATALPAPVALAASWDPTLANAYGARIATELRVLGYAEGLGGGVNLTREPRDGRTFEYMGEDPVLTGTMSAARTIGTQAQKVIATIKHYAMNDQETNRMTSNSVVDERTMRETELLAFELGVTLGTPGNVMCSYNLVNGVYACENPYLLTSVLKTSGDSRAWFSLTGPQPIVQSRRHWLVWMKKSPVISAAARRFLALRSRRTSTRRSRTPSAPAAPAACRCHDSTTWFSASFAR